jgi:hypothetical protein
MAVDTLLFLELAAYPSVGLDGGAVGILNKDVLVGKWMLMATMKKYIY